MSYYILYKESNIDIIIYTSTINSKFNINEIQKLKININA